MITPLLIRLWLEVLQHEGGFVTNDVTASVSQCLNSFRPLFVSHQFGISWKKLQLLFSSQASALSFNRPSAGADLQLAKHFLIYPKYFISVLNVFGNVTYSQPLHFVLSKTGRINLYTTKEELTCWYGFFFFHTD